MYTAKTIRVQIITFLSFITRHHCAFISSTFDKSHRKNFEGKESLEVTAQVAVAVDLLRPSCTTLKQTQPTTQLSLF